MWDDAKMEREVKEGTGVAHRRLLGEEGKGQGRRKRPRTETKVTMGSGGARKEA